MDLIEMICYIAIILRCILYFVDDNLVEKMMDLLWIILNLLILIYLKK